MDKIGLWRIVASGELGHDHVSLPPLQAPCEMVDGGVSRCNSSFPNGYKYPGSRGVQLTPISLRIRAHIRVHMKLTSDMEATCCIYIAVKHMYVDTQTRTPTDVLADLIDN